MSVTSRAQNQNEGFRKHRRHLSGKKREEKRWTRKIVTQIDVYRDDNLIRLGVANSFNKITET